MIRTDGFRTSASCGRPSVCVNMSVRSRTSVRKGARTRIYSNMRDEEEDRLERVEQLKRSKAGLIGTLRKTRKEIAALLIEGESLQLKERI